MPLLLVLLELALILCMVSEGIASASTHCSVVPSGTLQVLNGWLAGLALQGIALNVCQLSVGLSQCSSNYTSST